MTAHIQTKQSDEKDFPFSDYEWEFLDSDNPLQPEPASASSQYDGLSLYFRASGQLKPLSKGEDLRLGKRIAESQDDDLREQARQRLAEGSFHLVIHIAKEIKKNNALLDMRDSIQAGYLGLMTAVDKYDYKRGIRFSTFAYWWIKKAIYESIEAQQNLVRVPKGLRDYIRKYKKTSWQLRNSLSREPSLSEIAQSMNLPLTKIEVIAMAVHQEEMVYFDHLENLEESNSN
jgi:RNA polymerase primary sigma factor